MPNFSNMVGAFSEADAIAQGMWLLFACSIRSKTPGKISFGVILFNNSR